MRQRVPHLVVHADEAIGVVGPLVLPGRTSRVRWWTEQRPVIRPGRAVLAQPGGAGGPPPCSAACDTAPRRRTAALARPRQARRDRPGRPSPVRADGTPGGAPDLERAPARLAAAPRLHLGAVSCGRVRQRPTSGRHAWPGSASRVRRRRRSASEAAAPPGRRCPVRSPAHERVRVLQVVRRRQQVRVGPQRVPPRSRGRRSGPAQSTAASRSIRGRSSRPTSVAKVRSDGPPVARRRRIASASARAVHEPRVRGGRDHGRHPPFHQGERGLQPGERRLLLRGVLRPEQRLAASASRSASSGLLMSMSGMASRSLLMST